MHTIAGLCFTQIEACSLGFSGVMQTEKIITKKAMINLNLELVLHRKPEFLTERGNKIEDTAPGSLIKEAAIKNQAVIHLYS